MAVVVILVLSLVAACAPAAPTPTRTPEPIATPIWLLVSKPAQLEGIWLWTEPIPFDRSFGGGYYRWDADGTVWWANDADMAANLFSAKFWFEDGLYYEDESPICPGIGVYKLHLAVEGGRAVRLRMQLIEERGGWCSRINRYENKTWRRVD